MIKYIAYVSPTTGEIISTEFARGSNNPEEGLDESQNLYVVHIIEELASLQIFAERHYRDLENNEWIEREARPNQAAVWNGSSWVTNPIDFKNLVRPIRDRYLAESDWTQLPDCTLSSSKRREWATYRQWLRQVPNNLDENITSLDDVIWPEQPQ